MQKIIFSNHARYQLLERGITVQDVRAALAAPDKTVRQSARRFQSVARINTRYALVVVYDRFLGRVEIVTAFKTSKIFKYL
ncbi:MAG: hypothetical protein A3H70_01010 [Candidatus Komeilibacteria bacterium RIFCSPLOWO2_02_FULL_48_11]|uniref:DUF4258 domain-containing protein n=1 Tax=Candidatus Komeilibacteria bacterium RIFCSPLOWO2_02_FULL_48_11 TaxID=1798553 RepID=A0A1G2BSP5_9BACT|nr:MAG: hypothetical protein A3H70_01010 [Candidatus Komeilibacteria bacterium RIFCSPLOWO2_02_FULL_48_11]